jgi:predicted PurR-regulated permease PerM
MLARRLGGSDSRSSVVIGLVGSLSLGVPLVLLGGSLVDHAGTWLQAYREGTLAVPAPSPSVAEWPAVGPMVFKYWQSAHQDLPELLAAYEEQVRGFLGWVLSTTTGLIQSTFLFIASIIIAAVLMAYGKSAVPAMQRILRTVVGHERGDAVFALSGATVRSVASGVIGVAFIQALLLGIGFLMAGLPAAGLLALITLFIGILQLPALIISLPVIGFIWSGEDGSTLVNTLLTVYLLVAGAADGVLKPMLLGRGVDAPMPVILIGALGGMVSMGMLGLFIGAVVMAVGYQLFMAWVDHSHQHMLDEEEASAAEG